LGGAFRWEEVKKKEEILGRLVDLGVPVAEFGITASTATLAAAGALKPAGFFGFILENSGTATPGWKINPTARYTHARPCVEVALNAAGLGVASFSSVLLRKENGQPVAGHMVEARKRPAT